MVTVNMVLGDICLGGVVRIGPESSSEGMLGGLCQISLLNSPSLVYGCFFSVRMTQILQFLQLSLILKFLSSRAQTRVLSITSDHNTPFSLTVGLEEMAGTTSKRAKSEVYKLHQSL